MRTLNKLVSVVLIITLTFPLLADARAGRGGGFGGGFRTRSYQGGGYNYRPRSSYTRPSPSYPYTYPNRTTSGSTSFFSGLASGLLGAWLYNKMFSSNNSQTIKNADADKTSANLPIPAKEQGGFLRVILILLVAFLAWRLYRNRRRNAGDRNPRNIMDHNQSTPGRIKISDFMNLSKDHSAQNVIHLAPEDPMTFENILQKIQTAWSQYDLADLQRLTTPEMFQNFAEIIEDNIQQGITNYISQIKLMNQELLDAWQEGNAKYAKVSLTWSALDYAVHNNLSPNDPNYVFDGSTTEPTIATEIWTFRKEGSGTWLLAEIQQV